MSQSVFREMVLKNASNDLTEKIAWIKKVPYNVLHFTAWKNEKFPFTKIIFRETNYLVTSLENQNRYFHEIFFIKE